MKAIRKLRHESGTDFVTDAPEPGRPGVGQIKVRVAAASVCGSDVSVARYTPAGQSFKLDLPVTMGHEGAGIVVDVGEGVTTFTIGDHVALESHIACFECYQCGMGNAHICERMRLLGLHVDGLFAEFCTVPARAAYKLPDSIPLEHAALLEPSGVALHAIQATGEPLLGQRVLVTGAGPVGLFIAELAMLAGAARVVVVEPNEWRREFAESRGAVAVPPTSEAGRLRAHSGRSGFDVAFEASGHPSSFPAAVEAIRGGGTYVSVGFGDAPLVIDAGEYLNRRGIRMIGSFGRLLWSTWNTLVSLVEEGRLDLAAFITHRLPLSEFDQALWLLSGDACKVLLIPSAD
ncbi:MAG: L-threonine 3-dehydrogenase [Microbacterium sp.]|jgi:threonine 3-dehydrogenase|nr:L-threonine 3-dehydrogenase [Microbacterium sp.]